MPQSVINLDKINNMSAKMGRLSIPMVRTTKKIKKAKKMTRPTMRLATKQAKKVMKKSKGKKR